MNKKVLIWWVFVVVVISVAAIYFLNIHWDNQLAGEKKAVKDKILDSISQSSEKQKNIISNGKKSANAVKKKSNDIDTKLKDDEKVIDTSDYTDDAILDFITKHQER